MAELTADQAAAALGYHLGHLYRLLRAGTVKGRKIGGKVWMIESAEVTRVKRLKAEHGRLYAGQL